MHLCSVVESGGLSFSQNIARILKQTLQVGFAVTDFDSRMTLDLHSICILLLNTRMSLRKLLKLDRCVNSLTKATFKLFPECRTVVLCKQLNVVQQASYKFFFIFGWQWHCRLVCCAYYFLVFLDFSPVLDHFSWKAEREGENLILFSLLFANQPCSTGAVQQKHLNLSSSSSVLVLVLISRSGLEEKSKG